MTVYIKRSKPKLVLLPTPLGRDWKGPSSKERDLPNVIEELVEDES